MKLLPNTKQLGIGLLELMLSLAIIAILLVMAIRYYQSASSAQSINQAIDMVNAVKGGVKNYLTSNIGSTTIPKVSDLAAKGYLPNTYENPTTANPWGGAIGFGSSTCTDAATTMAPTFSICLGGIPSAICTQIKDRIKSTLNNGETAVCNASSTSATLVVTVST
jgi:type II secretory pathway pseudopilin PulG